MTGTPKSYDDQTIVENLKQQADQFLAERGWGKHHTSKNLAVSIAIEAAELMEHYQWDEYAVDNQDKQEKIKAELADIIIYCLYFANTSDIDISKAVIDKLDANAAKYPVDVFNQDSDDPADYERIKKQHRNGASNKHP